MSASTELVATWRRPRAAVRRHLARGVSEPFAFSLLLIFLVFAFVAQWPIAAREAHFAGETSALPRILPRAYGVLLMIPIAYALAAVSRIIAQSLGGKGSWYAARIALFWALATVSPLLLFQGLVVGMIGPGPALLAVSIATGLAFLWLWLTMLHEAEQG